MIEPFIEIKDDVYKDTRLAAKFFDELLAARNELFEVKLKDPKVHENFMKILFMK